MYRSSLSSGPKDHDILGPAIFCLVVEYSTLLDYFIEPKVGKDFFVRPLAVLVGVSATRRGRASNYSTFALEVVL